MVNIRASRVLGLRLARERCEVLVGWELERARRDETLGWMDLKTRGKSKRCCSFADVVPVVHQKGKWLGRFVHFCCPTDLVRLPAVARISYHSVPKYK